MLGKRVWIAKAQDCQGVQLSQGAHFEAGMVLPADSVIWAPRQASEEEVLVLPGF